VKFVAIFMPPIAWSGKAATKGYWKCHGKEYTENTEMLLPRILT
jgi:hypothetical protein